MRKEVGTDLALRDFSSKELEVKFLASACEGFEVVLEGGALEVGVFGRKRVGESLRTLGSQEIAGGRDFVTHALHALRRPL